MKEDELIDQILEIIEQMIRNGEEVPEELQAEVAQLIFNHIEETKERERKVQAPPSDEAQLLWILSGSNPEAFVNYLRTYPNDEYQQILRDPARLTSLVGQLEQFRPAEAIPQQQSDGIQKAPLQSSNIYGTKYDPQSGRLLVRFQSGSVYSYDGVPPYVFNAFKNGASVAKTTGHNKYGSWWKGKSPTLGGAFWSYIRQAGYPYKRLK